MFALINLRAPLAFVAVFFAVGIGLGWWLKPPPLILGSGLLLGAVGLGWAKGRATTQRLQVVRLPLAAAATGNLLILALVMALGAFRAGVNARVPPSSISWILTESPQPVTCEGILVSEVDWVRPAHGPAHLRGWMELAQVRQADGWVPACGRLLIRLPMEVGIRSRGVPPGFGDRVRLNGEVRRPRAVKDPGIGGFSEAEWFWLRGASGRLTVSGPDAVTRLDSPQTLWVRYRRWVADLRRELRESGRSWLGPIEAGYLESLLLAEPHRLPLEIHDAFRKTGTVHVLVVSGLQVGLIGTMIFIGSSIVRIPRATRYLLVGAGMTLYCTLTGSDPPILRATIMGLLFSLGKITGRESSSVNGLGLAALLILGVDPRALADVSFQLSFAAMGGLLGLSPWIEEKLAPFVEGRGWSQGIWRQIVKGLAASAGAWVAVSPVAAWHFHSVSPIALAANLWVIPWTSALIAIGLILYGLILLHSGLALPAAASFSWMAHGLTWAVTAAASLPGASWEWV
ncbi:MAG: ComEC/Rec2 family competence protein [Candidatus Omnitrophica bacterium]|nr:ComEC/Rec2 family competence protein [Candidatus Omnitrophota bacterium]